MIPFYIALLLAGFHCRLSLIPDYYVDCVQTGPDTEVCYGGVK